MRVADGDVLAWEEPPPSRRARWLHVLAELQKQPGKWALVAEDVDSGYAEGGVAQSLRRLGCQVATRLKDGRVSSVWARWPEEITRDEA